MELLVSTQWLEDNLAEPTAETRNLVVLDCTVYLRPGENGFESISGRADWEAGHIPGAQFADLMGDLIDADSPWGYALPSPEKFCAAMGALGVGDDSAVVLYDNNQSMWAARVWWMLRWVGFDNAALLNGGFKAWTDEGRPVIPDSMLDPMPATLTPNPRPELIADKEEVMSSIGDGATCLIDSLPEPMYSGAVQAYARPGHIPGAINAAASSLIDPDSGRYLPLNLLAEKFPGDRQQRIITYCGGGIAASSDAFILTLLRYENVAVYTTSLQEWTADPDAPLETL